MKVGCVGVEVSEIHCISIGCLNLGTEGRSDQLLDRQGGARSNGIHTLFAEQVAPSKRSRQSPPQSGCELHDSSGRRDRPGSATEAFIDLPLSNAHVREQARGSPSASNGLGTSKRPPVSFRGGGIISAPPYVVSIGPGQEKPRA